MRECPSCNKKWYRGEKYCPFCNRYIGSIPEVESPQLKFSTLNQPKTPTITCPYCQSTDTKKISAGSRWLSTGLFGLASGKVGKQWHCNKCKSDF